MEDYTALDKAFARSAQIVKDLGEKRLTDGSTLRSALSIDGVDYWNAVSPSLAVGPVAYALSSSHPAPVMTGGDLLKKRVREAFFRAAVSAIPGTAGLKASSGEKQVMFLNFSNYMFRETLLPVVALMSESQKFLPVTVCDQFRQQEVQGAGLGRIISIWGNLSASVKRRYSSDLSVFRRKARVITRMLAAGELLEIKGVPSAVLENKLRWIFSVYIPRLILYGAVARDLLDRSRVGLLVSPDVNDPRVRVFEMISKQAGIPILEVQLSYYLPKDVEWQFFLADKLAVTGDANRAVMLSHGIPGEKIVVTGSARYDWAKNNGPDKGAPALTRPRGRTKSVLFASQPYVHAATAKSPEERVRLIRDLFSAAANVSELLLLVKPHPLEESSELEKLASGYRNVKVLPKRSDIRELIACSDGFVTFCSNSAFDALIQDKPLIILPSLCPFFENSGAAHVARNEEEIQRCLTWVVSGYNGKEEASRREAKDRLIKDWLYSLDGRSAARIARLAESMLAEYRG